MHTSSHGRFYFPPGSKRLRVRRVRSRTAAESVCGLDVNQSLSQPTNYIPLTVHKASELTNLQAASDVGVRYTWTLESARETELRWKNHIFLLKLKARAGQRVTLFERLDWKTQCLMHTLANQLRSSQKDTWVFYASVDGLSLGTIKSSHNSSLKSAWRDHARCCVQIVTKSTQLLCTVVGWKCIRTRKNNIIWDASQTPDIQFCLLVQQTGTIIADDLYLCIQLVSTATTYL